MMYEEERTPESQLTKADVSDLFCVKEQEATRERCMIISIQRHGILSPLHLILCLLLSSFNGTASFPLCTLSYVSFFYYSPSASNSLEFCYLQGRLTEVLYRRSFHLDSDSKGMDNLFELDRSSVTRKGSTDMRTFAADAGFEAPRNSLDVPFSGLLEARRNSEVRCEEIPIGYELSRSLTTRRTKEGFSNFKSPMSASDLGFSKLRGNGVIMDVELDSKPQPRAPSVVARLMGLDALPRQEMLQGSHHSSLRRVSQECVSSYYMQVNRPVEFEASVEDYSKEKVCYGELSFRNHPQEKQLQEFKREFAARQALQGRPLISRMNLESPTLPQKKELDGIVGSQMDSEEFLDALDFLNANKDFFVKILKDPHSSFAKHLQQGGGSLPSIEDGTRQHDGAKPTKRSFECDVLSSTGVVLEESRKRQDMHQSGAIDKGRALGNLRWGRDDEMPGRLRWRTRGGSTVRPGGRVGTNHAVPTRIVVLKPNIDRQPHCFSSSAPLLGADGILKFRMEGKESVKQDFKSKANLRNDNGLARELFGDDLKDGSYDARAIAKQIVKHVKEDMSQRSSKDGARVLDSSGRRIPVQRVGAWSVDVNGTVDVEAFQRAAREAGKSSCSLPSSPRISKLDKEAEHRQLSFNGKRGSQMEEARKVSYRPPTSAAKTTHEPSKADENIMQGLSKKESSSKESKALKKTYRSNSLKVRDSKVEAPRVLPRSLSAPAAPYIENRALENESRGRYSIERATCSSRAKSSENSIFKERLLSLKDSLSLSKKRGGRKLSPAQCSLPVDSLELPMVRQIDAEPCDRNKACKSLARFPWQAAQSAANEDLKNVVAETSLNKMLSESSLTTSELPQWTSSTDLADTSSETSLDKCEQPSPVSVLETPFQEVSPSSEDTRGKEPKCRGKESKCHGFIDGLLHLDSDCNEQTRNLHGAFFSQPSSPHSSFDSSLDESLDTWTLCEAHFESVNLCGVACPSGSEEEFTYIMHVLSLSGLSVNGLVMAESLSVEHGLNQAIFGRLEAYYDNRFSKEVSVAKNGGQASLNSSNRRLLFDVVDEVIASACKKRQLQPWVMSRNQGVLVCTGKQLLEQIFAHINCHQSMPSGVEEEALEDMASKEMMKEAPWVHSQSHVESVVIELERLLSGDIIRELVHDLRR
ncbi:hypothetical protein GOP47_0018536 [Adiantum capillus-veneris]|uniref:DUF4378 domain-containing protein n=1 Tax=Adiantum capillus-veneris TaxID=13818 RepID=A0A9D4UDV2_ADICA|nr:hypothetical protein GOP47_0018536 [Adiantum capillus-veneris]